MKPENFCYWLQGKFELDSSDILTPEQVRIIKAHLNLVFFHAIDPETLKDSSEIDKIKYQKIHDGAKSGETISSGEDIKKIFDKMQEPAEKEVDSPFLKRYVDFPHAAFTDSEIKFNC